MASFLLDVNVLMALGWPNHVHHDQARNWFSTLSARSVWSTCDATELGFMRLSANPSVANHVKSAKESLAFLDALRAIGRHVHWQAPQNGVVEKQIRSLLENVVGHRQISDAYLVGIAAHNGGQLATFDAGLRRLYPKHVQTIPGNVTSR